jgi:predicted TIM-barrel fold metal-dependent hydrolase
MNRSDDWLAQVHEAVLESDLPIIDPHHHLWTYDPPGAYLVPDLWADTGSGHRVEQTVFVQCGAEPRKDGPEELRCVGETEFVVGQAAEAERGPPDAARIGGIVAFADHFGGVLGIGQYADQRTEVFERWKKDLATLAQCPNVVAKLGGMAMPLNGFGWERREQPATSDEFVAAQSSYYHYAIEQFGPERCMFESNFPVDKQSLSYRTLWNGFKKIAATYSDDEKAALFHGTAMRVYKLN